MRKTKKWTQWLSENDYRAATLSKLCLMASEIVEI